jgi:hypothetical protein
MQPQPFRCVLLIRLAAALLLTSSILVPFSNAAIAILAASALLTTFVHHLRLPIGTDGSDHMNAIVLATGATTFLVNDPRCFVAGAVFIALQVILSYLVAGIAKAFSVQWRSGQSSSYILSTWTYGLPSFGEFLGKRALLSRLLDWCVMSFEVSFPFALFLTGRAFTLVLLFGLLFHLFNALVMGLNTFFWAFIGGYPSMIFLVSLSRRTH